MAEVTDYKKEQALYYKVFGSLAVLTVITVAISNLKVGVAMAVILALIVATTKASLVASIFMHLSHEKKIIYVVLGLTAFFFVFMMLFIPFTTNNVPEGTYNTNFEYHVEKKAYDHKGHGDKDDHGGHH